MTSPAPLPDTRALVRASLAAALVAALVLVTAVLPAEYGIDPTGVGHLMGFTRLHDADAPAGGVDVEDDGIRTTHGLDARWRVQEFPVATQDGFTAGPYGETRVSLPLAITNLSTLTARLDWNDSDLVDGERTQPDLFELSIDGPRGRESQLVRAENAPDGRGNITVTLAWRSIPAPTSTPDGLLLPLHEADNSSHGNWTFTVRLYAARGVAGNPTTDPGNNWTLTVTAQAYELAVQESEGFSGDRVSLTLVPNQGVEYKFAMRPNASMNYRWEATAPLYWDLHAEEDGKDPEDFTRFAEGTGTRESGSLTASFPGRHGWYFLNRGAEPVTVTLETTGDYTILGVV